MMMVSYVFLSMRYLQLSAFDVIARTLVFFVRSNLLAVSEIASPKNQKRGSQ
jgi:hypothetical protein